MDGTEAIKDVIILVVGFGLGLIGSAFLGAFNDYRKLIDEVCLAYMAAAYQILSESDRSGVETHFVRTVSPYALKLQSIGQVEAATRLHRICKDADASASRLGKKLSADRPDLVDSEIANALAHTLSATLQRFQREHVAYIRSAPINWRGMAAQALPFEFLRQLPKPGTPERDGWVI